MGEARNLDTIVFDKTGTRTKGEHGVVDAVTAGDGSCDGVLELAAAVEGDSEHFVACAVRRLARRFWPPDDGDWPFWFSRIAWTGHVGGLRCCRTRRTQAVQAIVARSSDRSAPVWLRQNLLLTTRSSVRQHGRIHRRRRQSSHRPSGCRGRSHGSRSAHGVSIPALPAVGESRLSATLPRRLPRCQLRLSRTGIRLPRGRTRRDDQSRSR